MKSRHLLRMLAPLALLACAEQAAAATLLVTKSISCGCCAHWVEHMKKSGFDVKVRDVQDVGAVAKKLGVPVELRSCHTSEIDGYVIEGHVPAADVRRLLATKPKAVGLAVPGMAAGSPGMDHGGEAEPYEVLLFDRNGNTKVFAVH